MSEEHQEERLNAPEQNETTGTTTQDNESSERGGGDNAGSNSQNDLAPEHIDDYKIEDFQEHIKKGGQILKTRDDWKCVLLAPEEIADGETEEANEAPDTDSEEQDDLLETDAENLDGESDADEPYDFAGEIPDTDEVEIADTGTEETEGKNVELGKDENESKEKQFEPGEFKVVDGESCSWADTGDSVGLKKLRSRIEPWLTSLFQSTHLSLLVGSGLTHAVHLTATGEVAPGMSHITFKEYEDKINAEANVSAENTERGKGNFEDQIRVANELIRGLEILGDTKQKDSMKTLQEDLTKGLEDLAQNLLNAERNLIGAEKDKREGAFQHLISFLMSFASRVTERERLHLFTTNYDRVIEFAADIAGLRLIDRFVGALSPIFRASRLDIDMHYNPPGIRGEPRYLEGVARFTKLHGSLDWVDIGKGIRKIGLPFGAKSPKPYLEAPGLEDADPMKVMIYPNEAKDRETTSYPYVELFRDFAAAICRPNNTLICYGYSFGDDHINRVVKDMLTIPSTHLVIISYDDPLGRVMDMYDELEKQGKSDQITLMLGEHLGNLKTLVGHYLPKPAIDLTNIRMAELIEKRLGHKLDGKTESKGTKSPESDNKTQIKEENTQV